MKVLVLDSGNSSSYHAMRSLARAGHELHLAAGRYCHWRLSRYCGSPVDWPAEDPEGDDESVFVPFLLGLLEENRYGLLLSCGDAYTDAIYANYAAFNERVDCAMPAPGVADIVLNKHHATEFAARLGVPVPAAFPWQSLASEPGGLEHLPYPLVVKGQAGSGSAHVVFVMNAAELREGFARVRGLEEGINDPPDIQEYVGGSGYLVHLLYWHGKPYAAVCHRKDREFPVGGGVTAAATTVHAPELLRSAMRIADALEWHGLVKMDFVRDPATGEFKFIEIDPRVSASVDLSRVAGVDQVATLARLVEGEPVTPDLNFREGVKYRWLFPRDLLASMTQPAALLRVLPDIFWPNVHFDLSLADWRPLVYQLGRFATERRYLDPSLRRKAAAARAVRAAYEERRAGGVEAVQAP